MMTNAKSRENMASFKTANLCWFALKCLSIFVLICKGIHGSEPQAARLQGTSDTWQGVPQVRIEDTWFTICADSEYWGQDIADALCHHRGFAGAMIIRTGASYLTPEYSYVTCEMNDNSTIPYECEDIDNCSEAPSISCLFPGYLGCFTTRDDAFAVTLSNSDGKIETLEDCTTRCHDRGLDIAAMAFGQTCYCNHTFNPHKLEELESSEDCQIPCQGDREQACGGGEAMSVYYSNLGLCDAERFLGQDEAVYITSVNFPGRYNGNDECHWEVRMDTDGALDFELVASYRLDNNDYVTIYSESGLINITLSGMSGRRGIFMPGYSAENDVLHVILYTSSPSSRGQFVVTVHLWTPYEWTSSFSMYSSYDSYDNTSPASTDPPVVASNTALYIGIGAGAGVVVLLLIGVICIICARNRGVKQTKENPAAVNGNQRVTAASNAAYSKSVDNVAVLTANTPAQPSADDIHRYATIDGGYYYAPTSGNEPELPKRNPTGMEEAQYEELPSETAGTPYQSLTKSDKQTYQDLLQSGDQTERYTSLAPGSQTEYLVPM
ncbi:uncharacterized protein [Diadema antillarum]|uniref:uncharacterized protein n=1 Tax=Diadema antillarum TaxID=105358 RepID=UPI003A85E9B6